MVTSLFFVRDRGACYTFPRVRYVLCTVVWVSRVLFWDSTGSTDDRSPKGSSWIHVDPVQVQKGPGYQETDAQSSARTP
jgi:hypothetical protein